MPQLVVNMNNRTLINIGGNLKDNNFKLRHAPYSNRYAPVGETNSFKMEKSFFLKRLLSGKGKYVSV